MMTIILYSLTWYQDTPFSVLKYSKRPGDLFVLPMTLCFHMRFFTLSLAGCSSLAMANLQKE